MCDERFNRIEERQDRQDTMHHETIKSINELVTVVKVQNEKLDITMKYQDKQEKINDEFRNQIQEITKVQAGFKPFIDMMKSINQKVWGMIIGGIASMIGLIWMLSNSV